LAPDGLSGCNMICNGNSSEFCGGPDRLNVYGKGVRSTIAPDWMPMGCYTDKTNARTLKNGIAVQGGAANMTNDNCQKACYNAGYSIAGTEYSQECYCSNAFENGGSLAPDGDTTCNMACNGDKTQVCGGPDRLTVYQYAGVTPPTTPTNPQNPQQPAPANPAFTPVFPNNLPSGWNYSGCWVDNKYGRILYQQPDQGKITVESCISQCISVGKPIAGMEYSVSIF
jgi:hypothetical protein